MKPFFSLSILFSIILASVLSLSTAFVWSPSRSATPEPKLENPMSVQYLKEKLRKKSLRLVLNADIEKELKKKIETDPVIKNMYQAIRLNAQAIPQKPLLERVMEGRRLLAISREMLYRVNMLGMSYRMEKDKTILNRLNEEVIAVCNFSDWNPSHYLDVAEMSMAVAFAIDWAGDDLPKTTVAMAKTALIEKGIKPSYNKAGNTGWVNGTNNWNQVCHGGMIAAAIVIADQDPELAAQTIHRALEGMPHALDEYGPDGVYPEGATYWGYGTSFSVVTAAMFESAFGTDFGLSKYPAFIESATYKVLNVAPSGWYYNFADCGDKRGENGDVTLAWFAAKTGNKVFFEKERFLRPADKMGKLGRLDGAGLVWLSQYKEAQDVKVPEAWKGNGSNPIVIFKSGPEDPHQYYFGGKGGRGMVNHGNMDGGSFVFEVNGVRWAVDPGNQEYHELEKTGFDLWGRCQTCQRWTLLTKNNYGHSTLTINDSLHVTEGLATIGNFKSGSKPEATIEMTPTFAGQLKSAQRRFSKDGPQSLLIEDQIETIAKTKMVTWQLMTTADVEIVKGGAVLKQGGKKLKVENLSHPDITVSVISLYPAPLELDRQIPGLKRLELRIPGYLFKENKGKIAVRLVGE
ncbi:heparinase II/III domain-containing protein [Haliscomenobacter hydrossis]|uniref:Heparinase II/III family protein n=1 Tax=Haliscomenobacter hydrossis (strain ATCC 27775 / DSM 1100 / LMG 10767 / O) TaxID=760192 RepID=F4L5A0_HALH1|nr:heparinase II/III family protein [Haliscomenobacter hydrossis]AEE49780.1 heparinase II/III family protein [Haliscomenobacter hydrossis DSM 1100]